MVSIKDISKLTGYSVTTVSRALNNHHDVSEETKKKIQNMAKKMGYSPNILAQSLVSKKSNTFGFITSNFSSTSVLDSYSFKLFMLCVGVANEFGYEVVLIHADAHMHRLKNFSQIISERNLSGAIIQGFNTDDPICDEARESDVPTVFIDIEEYSDTTTYVTSNIKGAVEIGFSYLLSKGHKNVGFIQGAHQSRITKRWVGEVNEYLEQHSESFDEVLFLEGGYKLERTKDLVSNFYQSHKDDHPTALFIVSDVMAIGAMEALRDLGISVPKEVSILGYDGINFSAHLNPALTTIGQDYLGIAQSALQALLTLMKGHPVAPLILDVHLIERETVGQRND